MTTEGLRYKTPLKNTCGKGSVKVEKLKRRSSLSGAFQDHWEIVTRRARDSGTHHRGSDRVIKEVR